MHWLINRRTGWILLWTLLLLMVVVIANLVGVHVTGSIANWQRWMDQHAEFFIAWRLLMYIGMIRGWLWMRKRLLAREPGNETRQRLLRAEVAAMLTLFTLEISQFLQQ